jgi:hypothetical protein
MISDGNTAIVERDIRGAYHFNGNFKNAGDLNAALHALAETKYKALAEKDSGLLLDVFEQVFNHKAFTGRSGTFFSYEGLGSIYWHMVSKLHLAVQECCLKAIAENADPGITGRLLEHYYEIEAGIGVHKSPELYGAFPTDPYSHTPMHRGAQQPGMTGQVKEDILVRFGALGVFVKAGKLSFNPCLLRKGEFLEQPQTFEYVNIQGEKKQVLLKSGTLCFTCCQIPVVYDIQDKSRLEVVLTNGKSWVSDSLELDREISRHIFQRNGAVEKILVSVEAHTLKN